MTKISGCLNSHPRFLQCWSIHLQPISSEYLADFSMKQEFWRTCLPCLGRVWQLTSFVSYLLNFDSIVSPALARAVSCLVTNFATFEANSIWWFFNAHHPFWSRLLPGAEVSHSHQNLMLVNIFNAIFCRSLKCLRTTYLKYNSV